MDIIREAGQLQRHCMVQREARQVLALVPTMGNLHSGHLALVDEALASADHVVATIFVNPLQFGRGEDLAAYPRTLEADLAQLEARGCHCVFTPSSDEMVGDAQDSTTRIQVPALARQLCGQHRPGHFDGVATIVAKLFMLSIPHKAYFGLKDYQQFLLIRRMVADLFMTVSVIGVETIREADGLAMSSRNGYLDSQQRRCAPALYQILLTLKQAIVAGSRTYSELEERALRELERAGFQPDYVRVCQGESLQPARSEDHFLAIMAAASLGNARLIDNVRFELDE